MIPETEFEPIRLIDDQPKDNLDHDYLGLMPWAKMIAGVAVGTSGPFTIGVHGEWGKGKTTLLKLAQTLIEEQHPGIVTVWFNAWQFEREEHPLFPLLAAISGQIEAKAKKRALPERLKEVGLSIRALARGMKFKADVGVPLVAKVGVEFDAEKALEAERRLGKRKNPLQAETLYQSAFKALEYSTEKREDKNSSDIIVFVDDLDRCTPGKAVYLLESIKLILSQPGFVFVLALDPGVVEGHLKKRYAEECGKQDGYRGRLYMHKLIQLPLPIPSHKSRFSDYVERVIGRLEEPYKEPDLPEPIRALRKISSVIATGAGTNPRSLVRLINNFLLDCNLWPLIEHKEEYVALNADVAAALAFNRILQSKLEKLYPSLIDDQELCDAILDRRVEDCASKFAASAEPDELSKARPDIFSPDTTDKVKLVRELLKMPDILESLAEHGRAWLQSENLRRIVHEFSQTQRSEGGTADFPEPIARAIREALGLEQDEPIQVGSLASVVDLFLRGTQVTDEELVHLKNLSSLKRLDLGETQVTDQGLVYIKSLSSLQWLDLVKTWVTDQGLVHIKSLSSLRMLSLWGTQVTDQGLVHLQSLSSLHELYLGETQVTDAGLVHLKSISSLHFIVLFRTRVTDQGLVHLQSLSSLEALDLTGTQVTDAGLVHLKNLSSLQVLYLGETQVTDAGVEALKEALPNLRVYQQSVAIRPA